MNVEPDMVTDYPRGNIQQVAGNTDVKYGRGVKFGLEKRERPGEG